MHAGSAQRYASAKAWDAYCVEGNHVEWSGAEVGPLAFTVVAAAARVAARIGAAGGPLRLVELGCGTSGLAAAVAALSPPGLCHTISATDFAPAVIDRMNASGDEEPTACAAPATTCDVADSAAASSDEDAPGAATNVPTQHPAVDYFVADATALPMPPRSVHLLFAKTLADCLRTVGGGSQELVHAVLVEAHRVLVPGGALLLIDKHGPRLHWSIRSPPSYPLCSADGRVRWHCHEMRRVEDDDGRHGDDAAPPLLELDPPGNVQVSLAPGGRGLAVSASPSGPGAASKYTMPIRGDVVVAVNGRSNDAPSLRRLVEGASLASPALLRLERPIGDGWVARINATLSPPNSPCYAMRRPLPPPPPGAPGLSVMGLFR